MEADHAWFLRAKALMIAEGEVARRRKVLADQKARAGRR